MKTLKEFTKELQADFKTKDVVGAIAVWEINNLAGAENTYIFDTIDEAKKEALYLWYHKTKKEQEYCEIHVGYVSAQVDENGNVIPFYEDDNGNIDAGIYEEVEWEIE